MPQWSILGLLLNPIWFEFSAGLSVYWLWQRWQSFPPSLALVLLLASLALLARSAVEGAGFSDHPRTLFWPDPALQADGRTGLARALGWGLPCAGLLLGTLWLVRGGIEERLSLQRLWRFLVRLGDASYSLYLVHPLVLLPWQYLAPANRLDADLVIAGLVGLSCILALWVHGRVEVPILRLLRPLAERRLPAARTEGTRSSGLA